MNATLQAIQEQGRIKRQMIEQQIAKPFDVVMKDPHYPAGMMTHLMDRLHNEMRFKLDREMLETNPAFLVDCKDTVKFGKVPNVKITPVSNEKFYLQTSAFSKTINTDKVWPVRAKNATTEIELNFRDGVFV